MAPPFRTDIQALRAIAVLLVLAYHVWPAVVKGGYIGVDVFFVISGYLITGHLVREVESSGRVDLPSFYARRARRLLPAASLTLMAVGLVSIILMPPFTWHTTAADMAASALYAQNWALVRRSVDYLAQDATPSPLQHFWSLAVEEQFYVVWPLLVAAVAAVGRKRRAEGGVSTGKAPSSPSRTAYALPMGVLCAVSLTSSMYYARTDPTPGYFMTHVRLHELAAGGLLAVWACERGGNDSTLPDIAPQCHGVGPARTVAASLGLAAVVATAFVYTPRVPFPGVAALVPVAGAALVIAAGKGKDAGPHALTSTLGHPWLQYTGDLSYSLYLAHWPLVVVYPFASGRPVDGSLTDGLAVLAASWALAHACKRWWEDRFRAGAGSTVTEKAGMTKPPPSGRTPDTHALHLALAFTCAVLCASGCLWGRATAVLAGGGSRGVALATTLYPGAEAAVRDADGPPTAPPRLPLSDVLPRIDAAAVDFGPGYTKDGKEDCIVRVPDTDVKFCTYPTTTNTTTTTRAKPHIAILGDSHAAHWLPTLYAAARTQGWTVTGLVKSNCMPVNLTTIFAVRGQPGRPYTECQAWAVQALAWVAAVRPTAVIFSTLPRHRLASVEAEAVVAHHPIAAASKQTLLARVAASQAALADGLIAAARGIAAAGIPVLAIKHTPMHGHPAPACLLAAVRRGLGDEDALAACTPNAADVLTTDAAINLAARKRPGLIRLLDFDDAFCDATSGGCPPITGNVVMYRDGHHITATYARSLAPAMVRRLEAALPPDVRGEA